MKREIFIVAAKRTPFGRFLGSLSRCSAVDLACHAGGAALSDIDRSQIDQVIVGNVLAAGAGMNIARQVGVGLGLPTPTPAFTVNMMCASGMQAVALGAQAIEAENAEVILCGGTESMSNAPHLLPRMRSGIKLGDGKVIDSLLQDGLIDSFGHGHMALTAETLAREFSISRQEQDDFAFSSQSRHTKSVADGIFSAEIAPHPKLEKDEHPRPETTPEALAGLSPAFDPAGSVTAGNASGVNDGAAILLLASREAVEKNGWPTLARVAGYASVGCDPARMGIGPVFAIQKLLEVSGKNLSDYDQVEINEAFAAQALACVRKLEVDPGGINPHGGAIAMGHPVGASGARLVTHLAQQIGADRIKSGLASLCVGGGMGSAIELEKA